MNKPIVFLDLETTGVDIAKDRIVEIACVKFNGEVIEKHSLVNPEMPIPEAASKIHGITNEMVAAKPTFKQLSKSLFSFIADANIAGFNSNMFDVPLLYAEFIRAGIEWDYKQNLLIDVCNIYKRKEPRDLTAAYKFYCGQDLPDSHSALVDARATMKVFSEQCRRYDLKDENETALYSNFDRPVADLQGWFYIENGQYFLAKGKSKGSRDKGFIEWMLKLPELFPDAKKICYQILNEDK